MRLIVGLGNPDPEYQWTPHNLGFMAVDELANRNGIRVERPEGKALAGRGKIAGDTEGLLKLIVDRRTRRLVGVHVIGERATELVHIGQAVIHLAGTVDTFIEMVFNFPSLAEAYKYAAYDCLGELAKAQRPEAEAPARTRT